MISNWQTPAAIAAVLIALALLVRGALAKRKNPGCGGSCACPTDRFKASLKP
jgi:hypothetical protein